MAARPPYTVRLDAEAARELTEKGATLLLLGVPEHTVLGIDQTSFVVGPRFQGVKMVPPGPHIVSYASSSGRGDLGPTTSFFLHLKGGQVVVRRWDAQDEVLVQLADEEEEERYAAGVRRFDFDASLAPYDLQGYPTWQRLSGHISSRTVAALSPPSGNMSILAEADPASGRAETAAEAALAAQLAAGREAAAAAGAQVARGGEALQAGEQQQQQPPQQEPAGPAEPPQQPQQGQHEQRRQQLQEQQRRWEQSAAAHAGRARYTPLPRLVKRGGLTPAQLTALNLDKSKLLEELLDQHYGGSEEALLGEFQFAFLAFLVGQSIEGFVQWKAFLHLMFGCDDAPLGRRAGLFTSFLEALQAQLAHGLQATSPSGQQQAQPYGSPMMDELLEDSFLRRLCSQFFGMLHEERAAVAPALVAVASRVSELLAATLGWGAAVVTELGAEAEDEDAPVVVEGVELP